jgi:autotransporter passenger strand-loop-strand repeat protein
LQSGDTLTVNQGGTSKSITINDEATETVNTGGRAVNTTVNDGGTLNVQGGAIDQTTINGGTVFLQHGTADHTTLNFSFAFPTSELDAHNGSVVKNIVITGGSLLSAQHGLLLDATSTVENITFREPNGKSTGGAGLGLENPQNVTGNIQGLGVGDFIQFGGLQSTSPTITVTGFEVTTKNDLIITYNDATHTGLHATYHLQAMQPHTTFQLTQGELPGGHHFSDLTVIAEKTVGQHKAALESDSVHVAGTLVTDHPLLTFDFL